ncbi:MAG: GIY-YIG nuclease family protein [Chromatiales bacterium]
MLIKDRNVSDKLPHATSALYFLTHPSEGLLYIGKAGNFRGRWSLKSDFTGQTSIELTHACLDPAINLGNVRLSWWPMPKDCLVSLESFLIQDLSPKWNTAGRGPGGPKNNMREFTTAYAEYQRELARFPAERAQHEQEAKQRQEEVKRKKVERRRKVQARYRLRKKKFRESMKKVPCPYCQQEFRKRGLKAHQRYCNPSP